MAVTTSGRKENKKIMLRTTSIELMYEMLNKLGVLEIYKYKIKDESNTKDILKDIIDDYKFPSYTAQPTSIFSVKYTGNFDTLREVLNPKIKNSTTYYWYNCDISKKPDIFNVQKGCVWLSTHKNKYPIYIISKGRWESRHTVKALEIMNVDYKIVVEKQEYDNYSNVINTDKIICLPEELCNLNQGSIPVRNFILNLSRLNGDKRHWILDDNITKIDRYNDGEKIPVKSAVCFRVIEDYVDMFDNVYLAGMNYCTFAPEIKSINIITYNTRIYSCILIQNDMPYDWRGTYNEDTDLSLRVLKAGDCTMLFNNFLIRKLTTMSCKGGNTDSIYKDDGLMKKYEELERNHPDVVTFTNKRHIDGRPHHIVNYLPFKNNILIQNDEIDKYECKGEYNMELVRETNVEHRKILSITK